MKIVYISNSTIPSLTANSIQVMKMCQAMVQRGFDVELFIPRRRIAFDLQKVDLHHHYGIKSQFQIHKIFCRGRFGSHIYGLLAVLKAFRAKADIIFTRDILVAAIAARMKVPVICELHQMPVGFGSPLYFRLFLSSSNQNTVLVVITESLKRDLLSVYSKHIDGRNIVVSPDGVDMERFNNIPEIGEARQKLEIKIDGVIAGYSGHLYPGKGIEVVLMLAKMCPEINFLIVGGQPDDVATIKRKLEIEGTKNVFLQGFVSNTELPLYLAACDVLLLPCQLSISGSSGGDISRWTSPLKLFEYMACKRLIIASDLPVLREILNEEIALLCAPDNLDMWKQALLKVLEDGNCHKAMARHAYEKVQEYSWVNRVDMCLQPVMERISN